MSPEELSKELSYRQPLEVTRMLRLENDDCYPVCPKCGVSLDREYMSYSDRCGQCLEWKEYGKSVKIKKKQRY